MSAADRNKIIIAGAVAIVAIVVIVFFLRGRGGKQPAAAGAGGFGGTAQTAAGGTPPGQAAPAAPGGAVGVAGQGTVGAPGAVAPGGAAPVPGAPGATEVAQAAPAGGVMGGVYVPGSPIRMNSGPGEPSRVDPFLTFEAPPQPVPPEVTANLPPVVLQAGGLRPPGMPEGGVQGPLGRRRVAGLMFNDGAWAILEQENQSFIVKPGDIIDGNRITAIGPDSIFVTDAQGRRWQVILRALAPTAGASTSANVPAMPEAPPASEGDYQ